MVRNLIFPVLVALALAAPVAADPFERGNRDKQGFHGRQVVLAQQGFPGSQWAPPEGRGDRDRDEDRQREVREVPLSSILRDLRSQYGGQHLDAQKVGDRYRNSWITEDGRRLTIEVDASTGRTLSVRG